MTAKARVLTDLELEIMKIVWGLEKATVRDVYEELNKRRKIAYTTVMTMMGILEQKKHLKKSQRDRAYVYQPSRPQKEVVQKMVREFVNRVFNGSAEPLLVHLVEDSHVSEQTLKEVVRTLEKKPPEKKR
jgi:predicted transcriptional regulator